MDRAGLRVDARLAAFVEHEAVPAAGLPADVFWGALARVVTELAPRNRELLSERTRLQDAIDDWHRGRSGQPLDAEAYRRFLNEIGYLVPEGPRSPSPRLASTLSSPPPPAPSSSCPPPMPGTR